MERQALVGRLTPTPTPGGGPGSAVAPQPVGLADASERITADILDELVELFECRAAGRERDARSHWGTRSARPAYPGFVPLNHLARSW